MSWSWEYAFSAEQSAKTLPAPFLAKVRTKADELVRMCEAQYLDGKTYQGADPPGGSLSVGSGFFDYQIVVRHERVYVVQLTHLEF